MVEKLVENQILFYAAGVTILLGFFIKVIVGISLKRLVKAASNMSKSNHSLMRLVRAKFEHACMVSDRVQNVPAFVEKYVYEYKILGIPLHSLSQLEKSMIWLCGIVSILGAALSYYIKYDLWSAQNFAIVGSAGVLFLILLQVTITEKPKLDAAKMYMVDFLENTYAHRYEKVARREMESEQVVVERGDAPQNEVVVEAKSQSGMQKMKDVQQPMRGQAVEAEPVKMQQDGEGQRVKPSEPIQETNPQEKMRPVLPQVEPEPEVQPVQADKIREILEEFLA